MTLELFEKLAADYKDQIHALIKNSFREKINLPEKLKSLSRIYNEYYNQSANKQEAVDFMSEKIKDINEILEKLSSKKDKHYEIIINNSSDSEGDNHLLCGNIIPSKRKIIADSIRFFIPPKNPTRILIKITIIKHMSRCVYKPDICITKTSKRTIKSSNKVSKIEHSLYFSIDSIQSLRLSKK